uniref:hypothetical protein n=1 Tax=Faecalibacterium prausnitzii TaxID=853 RepID=UPI003FF0946C
MLSYRKLAMCVLGRPLHTGGGINSPRPASQRAAAFILTAAMLITLTAPAFAGTWYIEDGDITVKAGETEGTNKVSQGANQEVEDTDTIIKNREDTASSNTVTIDAGSDKVEVTLDNVNIKADSGSALTSKGDVTLTLKGDNSFTGGISGNSSYDLSGISSSGSLTISGGTVNATGGNGKDGYGGYGISSSDVAISGGTVNANGGDSKNGSGGSGIFSFDRVAAISGGTVNANGGNGGSGDGGDGIRSFAPVAISGGAVTANGGSGNSSGGNGIYSRNDIDLSGSLELTAKAGSPNGKALSQNGNELELDTIKDKLGPGAKVTATDADGKVNQVPIPRPVEPEKPVIPEESSSSSDGGSAAPSAPVSPLPGLTVTDKSGAVISYTSTQSGNTLTVCVGRFTASFRISLAALRQLRAEGIETITFQTILCSTTLSVDELLAMGGEDAEAVLTHRFTDSSLTVG